MRGRCSFPSPPQIVIEAFFFRLFERVLFDRSRNGELDGITKRAFADTVSSGNNHETATEFDPYLVSIAAKSAHFQKEDSHDSAPRIREASMLEVSLRKTVAASSGKSLSLKRSRSLKLDAPKDGLERMEISGGSARSTSPALRTDSHAVFCKAGEFCAPNTAFHGFTANIIQNSRNFSSRFKVFRPIPRPIAPTNPLNFRNLRAQIQFLFETVSDPLFPARRWNRLISLAVRRVARISGLPVLYSHSLGTIRQAEPATPNLHPCARLSQEI